MWNILVNSILISSDTIILMTLNYYQRKSENKNALRIWITSVKRNLSYRSRTNKGELSTTISLMSKSLNMSLIWKIIKKDKMKCQMKSQSLSLILNLGNQRSIKKKMSIKWRNQINKQKDNIVSRNKSSLKWSPDALIHLGSSMLKVCATIATMLMVEQS